jgi:hypothetical protein
VSASYLGSATIGAYFPTSLAAVGALNAAVGISLPEISAKLAGLVNISAALTIGPPDLTGTIAASIQTTLALQAAISGPTVTLQVGAIAALIAELTATLGTLNAQLAIAASLSATLGTAGLHGFAYTGLVSSMATDLGAVIAAELTPGDNCGAVLFVATSPALRATFGTFVGVSLN